MAYPIYHIDAFAKKPFTGNPAAVVLLNSEECDTTWMQSLAEEMNLSETAFVRKLDDGRFELRWFTPRYEVDLCGHATLAAAHAMKHAGLVNLTEETRFVTRSGELQVRSIADEIQLNFPLTPPQNCDPPDGMLTCFRVAGVVIQPKYIGRNSFDYCVVLDAESEVRSLEVDFANLEKIDCRGVMVTAVAEEGQGFDFVSRFFAPTAGVNEDPVTGSAHCCLADYWKKQLGRDVMTGYQASVRGGLVRMDVRGDRVLLSGTAVTVFVGTLEV